MLNNDQEEIVAAIYDVVSSPDLYDSFMLDLHHRLKAMRDSNQSKEASFFFSHLKRAGSLVEIVTPWRRDTSDELHKKIAQRMQATMVVDERGHILDATTSAKLVYNLVPGATLTDLPIAHSDLQLLNSHLTQALKQIKPNHPNDILRAANTGTGSPVSLRLKTHWLESSNQCVAIRPMGCRTPMVRRVSACRIACFTGQRLHGASPAL